MSLFKRGNVYWTYVMVDGRRYARSTRTGNRRIAETVEQRFKEELNLARNRIVQPRPEMPFGELVARFLAGGEARPWHLERLKVLLPYWQEIPIGRIHKSMVADYRRRRRAEKTITDTTVNRDLQAIRRILFWAVDEEILTENPLRRLRLVRVRGKPRAVLGLDEEALLLAAAAPHLRRLIIAAIDTGMRRGELLHERWEHVDFRRNLLFVTQSKTAGGEGREIPFTERLAALLGTARQDAGLLFTFRGNPISGIKTAWQHAIRRAGIRYLRFHDLRHTFNTRLMEAGVMQEVRKALMGHSSGEDVNSLYTHVELPAKREAIRKLERWVSDQPCQLSEPSSQRKENQHADSETVRTESAPGKAGAQTVEEKEPRRGGPGASRQAQGRDHRDGGVAEGEAPPAPKVRRGPQALRE